MANDALYVPFGEWDEADKKEAALLPEGEYVVKVISVEVTKIKTGPNEGTPGLIVWYQPVSGPYADKYIVDRFYTMKSTLWRFAGFLRAAGLKVTQNDMSLPYNQLVGRRVTATLKDGKAEGKYSAKSEVSSYAPFVKTDPMTGSGLTEDVVLVDELKPNISAERADTLLADAAYSAENPWALDSDISL